MSVYRDPAAPNPAFTILLSVRQAADTKVQWSCIYCKVSTLAFIQPRCANCGRLMQKVTR